MSVPSFSYTQHAVAMLAEREIDRAWVEQTITPTRQNLIRDTLTGIGAFVLYRNATDAFCGWSMSCRA